MKTFPATKHWFFAEILYGTLLSVVGFGCTLGLKTLFGKTYFTAMIAAVAIACMSRGWKAGTASLITGTFGFALLQRPLFSLHITSPSRIIGILVFILTGGIICLLTMISDRRRRELQVAESKRRNTEQWLQTAQEFTRFWTWEIDPARRLIKWANPYGELRAQVYEPLDSWLVRIDADDRIQWMVALDEAQFSKSFELEFRTADSSGSSYIAKGIITEDPLTNEPRLVGVSVQMNPCTSESGSPERTNYALYGIQDLLDSLSENPSLDRRARRNLDMARDIVRRLLPQAEPRGRAV